MNPSPSLVALTFTILAAFATPSPAAPRNAADTICPTQTTPLMPTGAIKEGRHDVVRVRASVQDGQVRDVRMVSGPPIYRAAIVKAMAEYRCDNQPTSLSIAQEFDFDATNPDGWPVR